MDEFEVESDPNVPWNNVRNNILSDGSEAASIASAEITVPEFQVRAAFYDFWNENG